jgi:lipopolysaccharide transport system permease protein
MGRSAGGAAPRPVFVYTPHGGATSHAAALRAMGRDLLGWRLFVRDVSAQYRQSVLGIAWAFLPPLLTGLVFIALQSRSVLNLADTAIPYPVFVLVGTTYWQVFIDAMGAPLKSVTASRPILTRIPFPREALILSSLYWVLFNALLKCVVLAGVFAWFDVPVQVGLLLAPLAVVMLIALGLGVGLVLAPVGMLTSDVSSGFTVATQLWFFATPVVYPPPATLPLSLLTMLNPVSPLLCAARDWTAGAGVGDPAAFFAASAFALVVLATGWIFYRIALPVVIERMGA